RFLYIIPSSFFFSSSCHHPHLHSFPTRRSSDLTNRKELLDPALLRPGRFDRHIEVDLPDKRARKQILQLHMRNKPLDEKVDLDKVAAETFGFSGAQLESLANEAAIYALRDGEKKIGPQHLSAAIDKVMMGEMT